MRSPTVLVAGALALTGCKGTMYSTTGDVMSDFTVEHATPFLMASSDADLACRTGAAMGPFLLSFGRVTDEPDRAAVVTLLSAGTCAEAAGWEAELRQLRAVRAGRADEAQDARLEEKRWHAIAAARYLAAWRRLAAAFGEPGDRCPELEGDGDRLLYLLGLLAGLNATTHDRAAGGAAGVPLDVPRKVDRAAACLADGEWFGVPSALRAAVWLSLPGVAPEGADPWAALRVAAATGDAAGVRLARAVLVQAATAAGRDDLVAEALAAHAASLEKTPPHPDYRLLDRNAYHLNLHVSDVVWTRETGHRTPEGAFGTLPGAPAEPAGDGDLLEGLTGGGGASAAPETAPAGAGADPQPPEEDAP